MRLKAFRLIVYSMFLFVAGGLIYTQVIRGQHYYNLSVDNSIRVVPIDGRRGIIFDRNGTVIAENRVSFDVMIIPQGARNKEELFRFLSGVLGIEKEKLAKTFRTRILAPFAPVLVAKDIKKEAAIVIEENRFRFPGLIVQPNIVRYYPFAEINAHILGYVGKISRSRITQLQDYGYNIQDIVGYSGVEEYYDRNLKGEDGGLQVEVNNRGEQVRMLGYRGAQNGQDITLTIDNRIQQMAFEALEGRKGSVTVMDLETGEILGMVNLPSYDPNAFVEGRSIISEYFNDSSAPLLNRAISGQYPPGSTFKIPISIGALENQKITPSTSFTCPGYYSLGRRQFKCSHTHGVQNLHEGIAHSCNVYFFNTGLLLGPELIVKYARMFGLGSPTSVDLPYEAKGLISDRPLVNKTWHKGDILNVSIGQGDVLVTPIQLVRMISAVAGDGQGVTPYVLKSIGLESEHKSIPPEKVDVKSKTFEIVKRGLRGAVAEAGGTARAIDIPDVPVFGKTGTAQTSGNKAHHAWFIGFCPTTKTKIVFCIFLEHGGSSYVACQVGRKLLVGMKEAQIL